MAGKVLAVLGDVYLEAIDVWRLNVGDLAIILHSIHHHLHIIGSIGGSGAIGKPFIFAEG
jgi:hypothetical protein